MKEKDKEEEKVNFAITLHKWIWRLLFLIVIIPFILFLLLQIPAVQNWSVDRLASYFSEKMDTKVEIDKVDLSIWRGLELDGFYIEDQRGDTLLYSEHLEVGLQKSLLSVFSRELSLNDVRLINGRIHIVTQKNESQSNVEILLATLGSRNKEKDDQESDPYNLDLKVVQLKNVHYQLQDHNLGRTQSFKILEGVIEFDKVNIPEGNIAIKRIFLDRPDIEITRDDQQVIIVDEVTGEVDTISVEPLQTEKKNLLVTLEELEILEGTFRRFDESRSRNGRYPNSLDISDMKLQDLNLKFTNIKYADDLDIALAV